MSHDGCEKQRRPKDGCGYVRSCGVCVRANGPGG
jgi:hypothetical protein